MLTQCDYAKSNASIIGPGQGGHGWSPSGVAGVVDPTQPTTSTPPACSVVMLVRRTVITGVISILDEYAYSTLRYPEFRMIQAS